MLQIQNLSVSYGETLILRDVELAVHPGEVVCLMGRNGVGKTTLLKSMMGLLRPRTGQILFKGKDLTATTPDVRARAGVAFQGIPLMPARIPRIPSHMHPRTRNNAGCIRSSCGWAGTSRQRYLQPLMDRCARRGALLSRFDHCRSQR